MDLCKVGTRIALNKGMKISMKIYKSFDRVARALAEGESCKWAVRPGVAMTGNIIITPTWGGCRCRWQEPDTGALIDRVCPMGANWEEYINRKLLREEGKW